MVQEVELESLSPEMIDREELEWILYEVANALSSDIGFERQDIIVKSDRSGVAPDRIETKSSGDSNCKREKAITPHHSTTVSSPFSMNQPPSKIISTLARLRSLGFGSKSRDTQPKEDCCLCLAENGLNQELCLKDTRNLGVHGRADEVAATPIRAKVRAHVLFNYLQGVHGGHTAGHIPAHNIRKPEPMPPVGSEISFSKI